MKKYSPTKWAWAKALASASSLLVLQACGGGDDTVRNVYHCKKDHPKANSDELKACTHELDEKVDKFIQTFMSNHGVTAATVTIMKGNSVLHEKGYGFKDAGQKVPLPANALMLASSTTKPVTAAAIRQLSERGALSLSDHVFCDGANAPCWLSPEVPAASLDPRVKDITVQHLLNHQGGWDREVSGDPYGKDALIQAVLGLSTPPTPADVTRFVLAQPLDFTPGTRLGYSNFGYMLLGQVIEKASAKPYISFVSETVMAPLGVSADDFQVMSSLMKDRNPREPNYITSLMAPSVFSPGSRVSALDGAVRSETWVAAGSWITTSRAMATFAGRYRLPDGEPLRGKTHDGAHDGEDPGASSIVRQLPNGVSYAVIMNRRNPLHDAIDQCVIDQCPNPPKAPDNEVPWQAQFQHGIDKAVSDAGF